MLNQPKLGSLKPKEPEPNPFDSSTDELKKLVDSSKEILVLIRENPKLDHVASALGLFLALKGAGKSVTIASGTEMRVEFNKLVGVNKIATKVGNRNLVVSFPYVKDSIEKVSYNVNESTFNLVVVPKTGFPALDSSKVEYSYSGAEADLVFTIGAQKLDDLGILYQTERNLFDKASIVNIDSSTTNTKFAQINLVWSEFSSCSEVVFQITERLGFKLDSDIATNLLAGVNEATQNLQRFNVKPTAFEAVSKLMQAGGKRPFASPMGAGSPRGLGSPFGSSYRPQTPGTRPFSQPQPAPSPYLGTQPTMPQTQPSQSMPQQPPQAQPASRPTQAQPLQPSVQPQPRPTQMQSAPQPQPAQHTQSQPSPNPQALQPQPAKPVTTLPSQAVSEPQLQQPQAQPQGSQTQPDSVQNNQSQDVQDDWLKPKIYKGSTKL